MGARGPKPKPTALRVLEGNPGRRPINNDEPRPTGEAMPPDHLSPEAHEVWVRITECMPPGLYTQADEQALAAFCVAAAMHRRATMALAKDRRLIVAGRPNPLLKIQTDVARTMASLTSRLGLSPADRSRLVCPSAPQNENSWTRFIASSRSSKG